MKLRIAIFALASFGLAAEVVDRIAISIGSQVVTQSMLRRQLRLSAFFGNREPDYSPNALKDAADRLIDQALIRREIELTKYTPVPMSEVNERVEAFKQRRNLNQQQLVAALAKYGFTEDDFKEEYHWQLTLQRFIEYRFRPSIQVNEAEIAEYYNKTFVPQYMASNPGVPPPALEQVHTRIVNVVASEKSTTTLFRWLETSRQQIRIRFFDEALK